MGSVAHRPRQTRLPASCEALSPSAIHRVRRTCVMAAPSGMIVLRRVGSIRVATGHPSSARAISAVFCNSRFALISRSTKPSSGVAFVGGPCATATLVDQIRRHRSRTTKVRGSLWGLRPSSRPSRSYTDPGPIGGRSDELDACSFQGSFNVKQCR